MKSRISLIIMALIAAWLILSSCSPKIGKGWYTYRQIKRAGYDCKPFKGRHYIRPTSDSSKVNIVKL